MATTFTFNTAHSSSAFAANNPSTPNPYAFNTRKRSREGPVYSRSVSGHTPFTQQSDWSYFSKASSIARSADAASPLPLVDTRYIFANGVSTPTVEEEVGERYDRGDQSIHAQYRRRWSITGEDQGPETTICADQQGQNVPLDLNISVQRSPGWGKFVFNIVGGVAGKMWDFCRGAAFKGFYAGEGRGYEIRPAEQQQNLQMAESIWEDLDSRHPYNSLDRSPLPGQFPDEQPGFNLPPNEDTPPRPSKRLQTDAGSGWIYVSHDLDKSNSRGPSPAPRSRNFDKPASPSQIPRPSLTHRRSLIPVTRRTSGVSVTGSPAPRQSLPSLTIRPASRGSPSTIRQRQYTRQSYDAPALLSPIKKGSPLSPEVQKYAARLRREELEADASMNRLSAQLNALIKQGKEALHSKIEVEYGEDEGFSEGRW